MCACNKHMPRTNKDGRMSHGGRSHKRKFDCLEVQKVPVPKGDEHIPPPHGMGIMPVHEFTMGLIAPKGCGKTTTIINLLRIYSGYFNDIRIYSPTIMSDSKWDHAKQMKCLVENTNLKAWCNKLRMKEEEDAVVKQAPVGNFIGSILEKKFTEEIPDENFIDSYKPSDFMAYVEENKKIVNLLKEHGQLKTLANRILVIFDDQVGSELFSGPMKKLFVGFNTRHRHYSCSVIMVSQGYKEIPKTIRTNWTCLLLYRIGNMKEKEVIYEEFEMGLSVKNWLALYDYAVDEDYSFLFIDMYCKDRRLAMRKGFSKALAYLELRDADDDVDKENLVPSKKRKRDDEEPESK